MKSSALMLGALAAIGCRREVRATQPVPPRPPSPFQVLVSGVHFDRDEAVECIEMTANAGVPADRAKAEQLVRGALTERLKGGNGVVPIQQTCGQQFGGRPLFASCSFPPSIEGPLTVSMQTYFLSFAYAFGDDRNMKGCVSANGRWKEMPRTSNDFIEAKLQHDARALEQLAGGRQ